MSTVLLHQCVRCSTAPKYRYCGSEALNCVQLVQEAAQLGSGMQPSTIAAILLQSMHSGVGRAVRKQAALAGIDSEEEPIPLTACTSESLSLLQQLRATTWAVLLDEASASLLSELCIGAGRWADAAQVFEQRKTASQVMVPCLSACTCLVR